MKIRNLILGAAVAAALTSQAQQINPLTRAVLNSYAEILAQDPKDYITLYQRGSQYYQLSMYPEALADIDNALQYTPAKDKDMRNRELSLLADICIELKQYDKALEAVDGALALEPDSYADLYKKGNICLYLKQPEDALRCFTSMQRMKSRSQEAFFGMAKANIMLGRIPEAEDLMKEAENAAPSSYLTYCRLGDLYVDMKNYPQAAANYLNAIALSDGESRPLDSLASLAAIDFGAVDGAIEYALGKTDNKLPLLYIDANLAFLVGNYNAAYPAFKSLLKYTEAQDTQVYTSLAMTCLALDNKTEALEYIDKALGKGQTAASLVVKAQIERALGNYDVALVSATKARQMDPADMSAMTEMALADIGLKRYEDALKVLNEAVLTNADNPYPLMIRAWLNRDCLNNPKAAVADYNRVLACDDSGFPNAAYKAMAQTLNGKKLDGDATLNKALTANPSADAYYYAAVYYAQTGDLEKAKMMRERAVAAGFSNKYMLDSEVCANLDLAPLRRL